MEVRVLMFLVISVAAAAVASVTSRESSYSDRWTYDPLVLGPDLKAADRPLILGHRGASGMFPEHTQLAYEKASEQGSDYVECDVVVTKDLHLVCNHDPWISDVTNVANNNNGPSHADFSSRRATYDMDDDDPEFDWGDAGNVTDFFSFDFTLEELRTLRRSQARAYRDPKYNWQYTFVTFQEYLMMAKEFGFGIYPEVKHGAGTNKELQKRGHNVTVEELLLRDLTAFNYTDVDDPCLVQAFELTSLRLIKESGSSLRTIFLLKRAARTTDADLDAFRDAGIFGLGLDKDLLVVKNTLDNHINYTNRDLVDRLHARGMAVHVYTLRNEYMHLAFDYGQDPYNEYQMFVELGVDAMFTDFPGSLANFFSYKRSEHLVRVSPMASAAGALGACWAAAAAALGSAVLFR